MNRRLLTAAAFSMAAAFSTVSQAGDPEPIQLPDLGSAQSQQLRGSELMTAQERAAFRAKMQAAGSREERLALREAQHKLMQQRAKERGMTLAPMPEQGQRGPGRGMGSGFNRGNNQ